MQPRNPLISDAERFGDREGSSAPPFWRGGIASDGVFDFGMFATDDPVTWENHAFPRETPAQQGAGNPSLMERRRPRGFDGDAAVPRGTATEVIRLAVGQRQGKTVAEADEGVEVGGPNTSSDAGEGFGNRPGRAKAARVGRNFRRET